MIYERSGYTTLTSLKLMHSSHTKNFRFIFFTATCNYKKWKLNVYEDINYKVWTYTFGNDINTHTHKVHWVKSLTISRISKFIALKTVPQVPSPSSSNFLYLKSYWIRICDHKTRREKKKKLIGSEMLTFPFLLLSQQKQFPILDEFSKSFNKSTYKTTDRQMLAQKNLEVRQGIISFISTNQC